MFTPAAEPVANGHAQNGAAEDDSDDDMPLSVMIKKDAFSPSKPAPRSVLPMPSLLLILQLRH